MSSTINQNASERTATVLLRSLRLMLVLATSWSLVPHRAAAQLLFEPITVGPIVSDGGISGGVAWGDYNNDSWIDLFITNWSNQSNFLYWNQGDGTFEAILTGAIVNEGGSGATPFSSGPCWGDFDNDGDLDLFVANQREQNNLLYRNNGDGTFSKITEGSIVNDGGASFTAAWGDYDQDGWLDLFVANGFSQSNFLYHNEGNGSFSRVATGLITSDRSDSLGATWGDYDGDSDLDLFVANRENQDNQLFRNEGSGEFSLVTEGDIVNDGSFSHGGSWGDYDNDGDLDLFVANGPYSLPGQFNRLYRNDGGDVFVEVTDSPVSERRTTSGSGTWADFDNDGDLDLFVANYLNANELFENNGDGTLSRISGDPTVSGSTLASGNAAADLDNDGDLDLFVANWNNQNNSLFINQTTNGGWLRIRCVGMQSNTSGVGAKVRITATFAGRTVEQLREVRTNNGHRSQGDLAVHFGLADATIVDTVVIEWPSLLVTTINGIEPNRSYAAIEGLEVLCSGTDSDADGFPDQPGECPADNCRGTFNPDQIDTDGNGVGDACQTLIRYPTRRVSPSV